MSVLQKLARSKRIGRGVKQKYFGHRVKGTEGEWTKLTRYWLSHCFLYQCESEEGDTTHELQDFSYFTFTSKSSPKVSLIDNAILTYREKCDLA